MTAEIIDKAVEAYNQDQNIQNKIEYDQKILEKYCSMTTWIAKLQLNYRYFHKFTKKKASFDYHTKYIINKEESFCGERLLRLHQSQGNLQDLSYEHVQYCYRNSKNSVFIFGFIGVFFQKDEIIFDNPDPTMIENVSNLARNPNNSVFILTEFDSQVVDRHLGNIQGLILITNGGMRIKKNGIDNEFQYTLNINQHKYIWKPTVLSNMNQFVSKTNGSYIIELENEISWQFENVSPEFAFTQKNELSDLLVKFVEGMPGTEVFEGQNRISVRPSYMNKSIMGELAIKSAFKAKGKIGFLMCIGGRHKFEEGNQEMISRIGNLAFNRESSSYFEMNAQKIIAFILANNQSSNLYTLNALSEVNEFLDYIIDKDEEDELRISRNPSTYSKLECSFNSYDGDEMLIFE